MSDIFREVEEDVRKERLQKLWKAYGDYAIALIALIVLSVAGYELWQRYEESQRAKASAEFVTAQHVNNAAQSVASFDSLSKTAPGGYGELAKLAEADAMPAAGQTQSAIGLYKDIANSDSGPVGATALARRLADGRHGVPRRSGDPAGDTRHAVQPLAAAGARNPGL